LNLFLHTNSYFSINNIAKGTCQMVQIVNKINEISQTQPLICDKNEISQSNHAGCPKCSKTNPP